MIGTLFALIFSLVYLFFSPEQGEKSFTALYLVGSAISAFSALFAIYLQNFALAKSRKTGSSVAETLFLEKKTLALTLTALSFYFFLSIVLATGFTPSKLLNLHACFAIWLLLLGINFDLFYRFVKTLTTYTNPHAFLGVLEKKAAKSHIADLCHCYDAALEIAFKALVKNSLALSSEALYTLRLMSTNYLKTVKSPSEEALYPLYYLDERILSFQEKALQNGFEALSNQVLSLLGHEVASAYNLSQEPVQAMGKCGLMALQKNLPSVAEKTMYSLQKLAHVLLQDAPFERVSLKDVFVAIIVEMDQIAKETFKKDKTVSIPLLTHPLRELKNFLEQPGFANMQDKDWILREINRVLGEFATLEQVLRSIPPLAESPEQKNR